MGVYFSHEYELNKKSLFWLGKSRVFFTQNYEWVFIQKRDGGI